jgi:hypothetical protein
MLAPGKNYVETTLRLTATFRDSSGDLVDPTTVTFETYSPCGNLTTYVYNTDSEVTRSAAGRYAAEIEPDEVGRWRFRWKTTTPGHTDEGDFLIQDSPFAPNTWPCCDYTW